MRRAVAVSFAVLLLVPVISTAQVVDGVQVGPEPPNRPVRDLPGPGDAGAAIVAIDFDDQVQPCTFAETVALTDEYAALGVVFSGPGGNDGGAILDECGGFGVNGHSAPNFLAFNINSGLSNGGIPRGPETITFSPAADSVSIAAGHASAGTITMECFDGGGAPLGSDSLVGSSTLQPLEVAAAGIASCVLSFTGAVAVFDDLTFDLVPVELQSFSVE